MTEDDWRTSAVAHRVRFQPAEIVMVPSWKELTKEMNYRPQGAQRRTLRVDIDRRDRFRAQSPSAGSPGIVLGSLCVCTSKPSQAPCSPDPCAALSCRGCVARPLSTGPSRAARGRTVADEQPDQATIFQDGGQRHNRRGAENIGVCESTRPPVGWPGRSNYIRRRVSGPTSRTSTSMNCIIFGRCARHRAVGEAVTTRHPTASSEFEVGISDYCGPGIS